jgi:hypothetical protein
LSEPATIEPHTRDDLDNVRLMSAASDALNELLHEAARLTDPEKLRALVAWLRNGDAAHVDFLIAFARFWHEAIAPMRCSTLH